MCDSVPSASYSGVCNVLRQWNISLIPTYRVYRLYDIHDCNMHAVREALNDVYVIIMYEVVIIHAKLMLNINNIIIISNINILKIIYKFYKCRYNIIII